MRISIVIVALLATTMAAHARGMSGTGSNSHSHSVSGYTNSHGTYVAPHYSTNPNRTQLDNYGTRGNVNPYTGGIGSRGADY